MGTQNAGGLNGGISLPSGTFANVCGSTKDDAVKPSIEPQRFLGTRFPEADNFERTFCPSGCRALEVARRWPREAGVGSVSTTWDPSPSFCIRQPSAYLLFTGQAF